MAGGPVAAHSLIYTSFLFRSAKKASASRPNSLEPHDDGTRALADRVDREEVMRILFTIHPAYGHFHPLLPFAAAARDAGHEVAFATSALFGPVVEATGFGSLAAGLPCGM